MQLPSVSVDLSSVLVSVTGVLLLTLANRALKGMDEKFTETNGKIETVHTRVNSAKTELTAEIKEVKGDLVKHRDRTENLITATRADLEDKLEVHDQRIRDLEIKD